MKPLRVAIVGASGKMGQDLKSLILSQENILVGAEVGRETNDTSVSFVDLDPGNVDGLIDFSMPENLKNVLQWSVKHRKPAVIATTGFQESPQQQLEAAAREIPVLWSPNMSLGVAYLQEAIRHFDLIRNFDFQIEEVHHTKKKDAPSGTALFLQAALKQAIGKQPPPVLSIRAGNIFGIHRVMAFGPEETVTLEHQALNRRVFSRGALTALQWLTQQNPGLYMLADIFKPVVEQNV